MEQVPRDAERRRRGTRDEPARGRVRRRWRGDFSSLVDGDVVFGRMQNRGVALEAKHISNVFPLTLSLCISIIKHMPTKHTAAEEGSPAQISASSRKRRTNQRRSGNRKQRRSRIVVLGLRDCPSFLRRETENSSTWGNRKVCPTLVRP